MDGKYEWADGKSVDVYDSTVVAVHTDAKGIVGYGEVVPLGPNYLASYAAGVRAGLAELCPRLIGRDPTSVGALNRHMDYHLKGHPYVKSPVDMACWDILGKVASLPAAHLLGGPEQTEVMLYRAIPQRQPKEMAGLVQKYKGAVLRRKPAFSLMAVYYRIKIYYRATRDFSSSSEAIRERI